METHLCEELTLCCSRGHDSGWNQKFDDVDSPDTSPVDDQNNAHELITHSQPTLPSLKTFLESHQAVQVFEH